MSEAWREVDLFLAGKLLGDAEALDAALKANAEAGLPAIDVSPVQGKLLHLLARAAGARRILAAATNLPADVVASSILPTVRLDVPASDVAFWIGTLAAQGAVRARLDTTGLIVQ